MWQIVNVAGSSERNWGQGHPLTGSDGQVHALDWKKTVRNITSVAGFNPEGKEGYVFTAATSP